MRPSRATVVAAAVAACVALLPVAAAATPGAAPPLASSGTAAATSLADTVRTAGRVLPVAGTWQHAWPGVYFEGRFRGTGVGIVLDDATGDYDVQVDGRTVETLVAPGATTHVVDGLPAGEHDVRVVKRSEAPWATSTFGGFVPHDGSVVLPAPAPRDLQIEYVGDSYTVGYGNTSTSRTCTGDQVTRTTDADLSFGALTARALGADYQLNAFSGRGMVRNYAGSDAGTSYRTYYDRVLPFVPGTAGGPAAGWDPDAVVIGLGINDFSTALGSGEAWARPAALREAWVAAYHGFLDDLRDRYGDDTWLVVSATSVHTGTDLKDLAQRVVDERRAAGDDRVVSWYYGSEGLDYGGCDWHPSVRDHQVIAAQLTDLLEGLGLGGGPTPSPTPTVSPTPTPTVSPSPTPTASPTPTPSPTSTSAAACRATLTVGSTWPGGYQATVDVTAGTAPLTRWTTTFTLPGGGAVTQSWSAAVATTGSTVTATNAAWNGSLAAGATTAFGFVGSGTPPTSGPVPCST
ncbi:cellulose binding domain-containing protein [Cellulomonas iranensis]|uniref:cellulose binding domain-containing protein n=1 Tax=Cellulomonas iranensis TaxID=76862 RepID=UPI003D7EE5B8